MKNSFQEAVDRTRPSIRHLPRREVYNGHRRVLFGILGHIKRSPMDDNA